MWDAKVLGGEIETALRRLMGVWFPRSVDEAHGGFLCDFDHRWQPAGPQQKMLEYQARQTLAAARAAARFPDLDFLRSAAVHGFRYLESAMWDHEHGGWYRMLDRRGKPLEGATKHGHGAGYALSACVACWELIGDASCLALAQSAFAWLDAHCHDERNGGYFPFYRRDGTAILSDDRAEAAERARDPLGTPLGCKDANTTSDMLRGFADLQRAWPDAALARRVDELIGIVRDRLVVAPGLMHMYVHPDWRPVPDLARYGQIIRSANHLISATSGAADPITARVVRSMIDTMLRIAWDRERGGFHLAGGSFGPVCIEGRTVVLRDKVWWVQADGLKALATMARMHGDAPEYRERFALLWSYVQRFLVDATHGGWLGTGLDTDPAAGTRPKATMWKDASHETEALLEALDCLGAL